MWKRKKRRRFADVVRSTIVLHLYGGRSIAGVLIAEYDDVVALTRARVEDSQGEWQQADGEILVPIDRIEWSQVGVTIDDAPIAGTLRSLPERDLQGTRRTA